MVRLFRNGKAIKFLQSSTMDPLATVCVECETIFLDGGNQRPLEDVCGHVRCLSCALRVAECPQCHHDKSSSEDPGTAPASRPLVSTNQKLQGEFNPPSGSVEAKPKIEPELMDPRRGKANVVRKSENSYSCSLCNLKFMSSNTLKGHLRWHQQQVKRKEGGKQKDKMRTRLDYKKGDVTVQLSEKKRNRRVISQPVPMNLQLKKEFSSKNLPWGCAYCEQRFPLFVGLRLHKKLHSGKGRHPRESVAD